MSETPLEADVVAAGFDAGRLHPEGYSMRDTSGIASAIAVSIFCETQ